MITEKPEILYYNSYIVPKYMRTKDRKIIPFLSTNFDANVYFNYEKFGMNAHNMIYDRTNILPHWLNIAKDKHPMPKKDDTFNMSFFDVCEVRAKELLALGKPINVLWSGGIDSTFALFTLRHFANDPDQVRVYGTYHSIIESGNMFDRRISKEFKHTIKTSTSNGCNYQTSDESIFVSGLCGNQLFGPTDDYFSTSGNAMFHHQFGTKETIYEPYEKHIDPAILEFMDPMIKASPKKLETVNDLRWYFIFNLDWYTAIYENKIQIEKPLADKMYGFFDHDMFQSWAINTNEPFTKVRGNPLTHRWQMRELLSDLYDEPHYAKHKDKKISTFSINEPTWLFLLSNYSNVYM